VPSQLLQRLNRFLDQQTVRPNIMALEPVPRVDQFAPPPASQTQNIRPHWPANRTFGSVMRNIQCVMIHETSGAPTYSAFQTFVQRYNCTTNDDRGIGPQYFIEPNGTTFVLIGDQDLSGDPRETWHGGWPGTGIDMNPIALGIENGDIGDSGQTPGAGTGPNWWALSNQPEDLTGMKAYVVLLPNRQEDAVLIWIAQFPQKWVFLPANPPAHPKPYWALQATGVTPGFQGPGDIVDDAHPANDRHVRRPVAWRNMLFTERNFRSLVLLCRLLAEQNGLPRNLPLLPYVAAATPDRTNTAIFRKLILAEQQRDDIATQIGTTTAAIQANTPQFVQWYQANPAERWSRLFGIVPGQVRPVTPCFRGFLAHSMNGGHPCPGPLFDWHRFARELWDWWWYPFDTDAIAASTTMRPYLQARSDTPLVDYYYDALGAPQDYNALHEALSLEEKFRLPLATPIYAMANGVVVAARFANSNNPATSGFLLVRHEVFYQAANNHIDYDRQPTFVWSLIRFLDNVGFTIPAAPPAVPAATSASNPTWLNRFIMRLRECELAVQFHTANAGNAALTRGWGHNPSGTGPRSSTGQEIERDATVYRAVADDLSASHVALFPLEASTDTTCVRVCLGDFLGFPNRMTTNQQGIQVEIFSKDQFAVPGAVQRAVSAAGESWWTDATAALRHESTVDADLPANGVAWQYRLTDFLAWINGITWASEWEKYGVTVGGAPAPAPPRPITRIVN
jgi:hypothetical protein